MRESKVSNKSIKKTTKGGEDKMRESKMSKTKGEDKMRESKMGESKMNFADKPKEAGPGGITFANSSKKEFAEDSAEDDESSFHSSDTEEKHRR